MFAGSQYIIFIGTNSCGKESLSEQLRLHFQNEQYFLHSVVCMSSSVTLLNTMNSIFNCGEQLIKFAESFQVAILDEIQEQTHEVIKKWKRNRIKVTYNSALNLKVECLSHMTKENLKTMFSLIKYKDNNNDIMCITTPISYKSLKFFHDDNVQFRVQTTKTFNSKILIEDVFIKINPITPPILHCKISYSENQMIAIGTVLLSDKRHADSIIIGKLSSDLNLSSILSTISHQELVKPSPEHSMSFGAALEVSMAFNITKECLLVEGKISNLGSGSLFYERGDKSKAGYALSVQLEGNFLFEHLSDNLSEIDKLLDIKYARLLAFSLPNDSFHQIEEILTNLFSSAIEKHKSHSVSKDKQLVSLKAFSGLTVPENMTTDVSKECSGLLFVGKVLLKTESGLLKRLSDVSKSSDTIDVGMWVSTGEKETSMEICGEVSELSLGSFTVEKATFNYSQKESGTSLNLYFSVTFEEIGVTGEGTMSLCEDKDQDSIIIGKLSSDLDLSSIVGTISHQELVKPSPEHSMSFGAALEVSMAFNISKECLLVEGKICNLGSGSLFYERGDKSKAGYALSVQLEDNFLFEHFSDNLSEIDKLLDIKYARLLAFSLPNNSFHQIEEILTNLFSSAMEKHKSHSLSKDKQLVSLKAFSGLTVPENMTTDVSKECSGLLFVGKVLLKTESGLLKRLSDVSKSSDTIDVGMWVSTGEKETSMEICGEVSELSIGSFTVEKAIFNYSQKESGTSLNLYFSVTFEEIGVTGEGTMSLCEDKDQDSIIIGKLSSDLNLSSIVGTISHQELVKPSPEHSMSFGAALEVSMAFNITKECLLVEGKISNLGSGSLFYERGDKSKAGYALSVQLEDNFLFEHFSYNLSEIDKLLDIKYARLLAFSLPNNSFHQIEEILTNLFSSAIEKHKSHSVSKDKQLVSLKAFSGLTVPENMTTDVSKECSGLLFVGKVLLKTESGLLKRLSDVSQSSDTIDVGMWVSTGEKETSMEICGEVSELSIGSFTVEKAIFNYSQKESGTSLNLYFSVTFEEIGVTGEGTMSLCEDKDQDSIIIGKLSSDLNLSSIVGTISHQELVKPSPEHSMSFGAALEVSMAFNITKECLLVEGKISNLGSGSLFYERGDKSKAGYALSVQLEDNFLFEHLSDNLSEIDKLLDIKYARLLAFSLPNNPFHQIEEILTSLFSSAIEKHKSHSVSKDKQLVSLKTFSGLIVPENMTTDVSKECSGLLFVGKVLLKTESGLLKRLSDISQSSDTIDVGMWVSTGEKETSIKICGEVSELSLGSFTVEKAIFNYSQKESGTSLNLYFSVTFEEIGVTGEGTMSLCEDKDQDSIIIGKLSSDLNLSSIVGTISHQELVKPSTEHSMSFGAALEVSMAFNITKECLLVEGKISNLGSGSLFYERGDKSKAGYALSVQLEDNFLFEHLSDNLSEIDKLLDIKYARLLAFSLPNNSFHQIEEILTSLFSSAIEKHKFHSVSKDKQLVSLKTFSGLIVPENMTTDVSKECSGLLFVGKVLLKTESGLLKRLSDISQSSDTIDVGMWVSTGEKETSMEICGEVSELSLGSFTVEKAIFNYSQNESSTSLNLYFSMTFEEIGVTGEGTMSLCEDKDQDSIIIGKLSSDLNLSSIFGTISHQELVKPSPEHSMSFGAALEVSMAFNITKECLLVEGKISNLGSGSLFYERGDKSKAGYALSVQLEDNFLFEHLSNNLSEIDKLLDIKYARLLAFSLPNNSFHQIEEILTSLFSSAIEKHKSHSLSKDKQLVSLKTFSGLIVPENMTTDVSKECSGLLFVGKVLLKTESGLLKRLSDVSQSSDTIDVGMWVSTGEKETSMEICGEVSELSLGSFTVEKATFNYSQKESGTSLNLYFSVTFEEIGVTGEGTMSLCEDKDQDSIIIGKLSSDLNLSSIVGTISHQELVKPSPEHSMSFGAALEVSMAFNISKECLLVEGKISNLGSGSLFYERGDKSKAGCALSVQLEDNFLFEHLSDNLSEIDKLLDIKYARLLAFSLPNNSFHQIEEILTSLFSSAIEKHKFHSVSKDKQLVSLKAFSGLTVPENMTTDVSKECSGLLFVGKVLLKTESGLLKRLSDVSKSSDTIDVGMWVSTGEKETSMEICGEVSELSIGSFTVEKATFNYSQNESSTSLNLYFSMTFEEIGVTGEGTMSLCEDKDQDSIIIGKLSSDLNLSSIFGTILHQELVKPSPEHSMSFGAALEVSMAFNITKECLLVEGKISNLGSGSLFYERGDKSKAGYALSVQLEDNFLFEHLSDNLSEIDKLLDIKYARLLAFSLPNNSFHQIEEILTSLFSSAIEKHKFHSVSKDKQLVSLKTFSGLIVPENMTTDVSKECSGLLFVGKVLLKTESGLLKRLSDISQSSDTIDVGMWVSTGEKETSMEICGEVSELSLGSFTVEKAIFNYSQNESSTSLNLYFSMTFEEIGVTGEGTMSLCEDKDQDSIIIGKLSSDLNLSSIFGTISHQELVKPSPEHSMSFGAALEVSMAFNITKECLLVEGKISNLGSGSLFYERGDKSKAGYALSVQLEDNFLFEHLSNNLSEIDKLLDIKYARLLAFSLPNNSFHQIEEILTSLFSSAIEKHKSHSVSKDKQLVSLKTFSGLIVPENMTTDVSKECSGLLFVGKVLLKTESGLLKRLSDISQSSDTIDVGMWVSTGEKETSMEICGEVSELSLGSFTVEKAIFNYSQKESGTSLNLYFSVTFEEIGVTGEGTMSLCEDKDQDSIIIGKLSSDLNLSSIVGTISHQELVKPSPEHSMSFGAALEVSMAFNITKECLLVEGKISNLGSGSLFYERGDKSKAGYALSVQLEDNFLFEHLSDNLSEIDKLLDIKYARLLAFSLPNNSFHQIEEILTSLFSSAIEKHKSHSVSKDKQLVSLKTFSGLIVPENMTTDVSKECSGLLFVGKVLLKTESGLLKRLSDISQSSDTIDVGMWVSTGEKETSMEICGEVSELSLGSFTVEKAIFNYSQNESSTSLNLYFSMTFEEIGVTGEGTMSLCEDKDQDSIIIGKLSSDLNLSSIFGTISHQELVKPSPEHSMSFGAALEVSMAFNITKECLLVEGKISNLGSGSLFYERGDKSKAGYALSVQLEDNFLFEHLSDNLSEIDKLLDIKYARLLAFSLPNNSFHQIEEILTSLFSSAIEKHKSHSVSKDKQLVSLKTFSGLIVPENMTTDVSKECSGLLFVGKVLLKTESGLLKRLSDISQSSDTIDVGMWVSTGEKETSMEICGEVSELSLGSFTVEKAIFNYSQKESGTSLNLYFSVTFEEIGVTGEGTMSLCEDKDQDSIIIGKLSSDLNLSSIVGTISHQELVKPSTEHSMSFGAALEVSMAFNITKECLLVEGKISNLGSGSLFYERGDKSKAGYALSVQLEDNFLFEHLSDNLSEIDKLLDIKYARLLAFSLPNNSFHQIEEILTSLFSSAIEKHKSHSVSKDKQLVSLKTFSGLIVPENMTTDVSKECSGLLFVGKVLLKTESGLLKRLSDISQSSDTIDVGMWVSTGEKETSMEICGEVSELSLGSFTVEKAIFNYSQNESSTSLNLYFSMTFEEIGVTGEGTMSLCEDKDQDSIIIGKLSSDLNLSSIFGTISHQELVKPSPEHSMSFGAALEVSMAFNITKECLLVEGKISNLGSGSLFYERGDKSKAGYALSVQLEDNFLFEHLSNNLSEIDKLLDIKYARLLAFSLPNNSFHQIEEILTSLFSSAIEKHKSHSLSKDKQLVSLKTFSGLIVPENMTTDVSKECSGLLFVGKVLLKTESGLLKRLSDVSQSSDTIDVGMWVSTGEKETSMEICGEVSELSLGSFTVEKATFNYSQKESGTSLNLYFSVTFEEIGVTGEGTMSLCEDKDQDSIIIGKLSSDLNLSSIVGTISHQELVKPSPEHSMSFGAALEVSMAFNISKECLLVEGKISNLGSGSLFYERGDKSKAGCALSVQLEDNFLFEHLSDNLSEIDKLLDIKYARLLAFSLPNNSFHQIEEILTSLFSSAIEKHKFHSVSKDKQLVSLKTFSGLIVPENMTTDVSKECSGLLFVGKVLLKTESGLLKRLSDVSKSSDTIDVGMWVSTGEKETSMEICGEVSELSIGSFTVEKATFNYSQNESSTSLNLYFSMTFEEIGVTGEGTMSLCEDKDQDSIIIGKLSSDLNLSSIFGTILHQELVKPSPEHSMSFGAALEVSMAFNITKECLLVEGKISNLGSGSLFYERGDKSKAGYALSVQLEDNFLFEHLSDNLSEIDKLLDIKYARLLAFSLPNNSFHQIEEILTSLFSSAIEKHKFHSVSKDKQLVSLKTFSGLIVPENMTTDVSKECSGLLFVGKVLLKTESGLLKRLSDISQSSDTIDVGMWVSTGEKETSMEICGEVSELSLGSFTVEKAIFNYSQNESSTSLNLYFSVTFEEIGVTGEGTMSLCEDKDQDSIIIGKLSSDLNLSSIFGTISHQELVKPSPEHSMSFGAALEVSMAFNITKECLLVEGKISNLGSGSLFYERGDKSKAGYALSVQLEDNFLFEHLSNNLSEIDKLLDIKYARLLAFSLPNNSFHQIEEILTSLFSSAIEKHKSHSLSKDKQLVSLKTFSGLIVPENMTTDVSKECSGLLFVGKVLLKTESGLLKRLSDVSQSSDTIDVGMWVSTGEKETSMEICGEVSELSLGSFTVEKATFSYSQKESGTSLNLYFSVTFEEIGVTGEGTMSLCEDKDQDSIIIGKLSSDLNLSSIVGTISHQELVKPSPEHSMSFGAALEVSMAFNISKECLLVEGKISNLGSGSLFYERGDKSKAGYALSVQLEDNFLFEHLSDNLSEIDKLLGIKYARLLAFSLPNNSFHQIEEILTNLFSSAIEKHKSHSVSKDKQLVSLKTFSGLTVPENMTTDVSKECSGLLFVGKVLLKTESGLLKRLSDVSKSSDTIDVGMWVSTGEKETSMEICGEVSELSIGSFTVEKATFNYSQKESGTSLNLYFSVTFEEIGVTGEGTMSLCADKDQDSIIIGKLSSDLNLSSIVGTISHQELVKPSPEHSISFGAALEVSMAFNISKECLLVEGKISNLGSGSLFYERGDKSKAGYALSVQLEDNFLFEHLSDNLSEIDKLLDIKYARLLAFSLPKYSLENVEEILTNVFFSAVDTHKSRSVNKEKHVLSSKAFSGVKVPENMTTDVLKECSGLLFVGKVLLKTESGLLKRLSEVSQSRDTIEVGMWMTSGEKDITMELCGEVSQLFLSSITVEKAMFNYSKKESDVTLSLYFNVSFEEIGVSAKGTMLLSDSECDSFFNGHITSHVNLTTVTDALFDKDAFNLFDKHGFSFESASVLMNTTKSTIFVEGRVTNLGSGGLFIDLNSKGFALSLSLDKGFQFSSLSDTLTQVDNLLKIKSAEMLMYCLQDSSAKGVIKNILKSFPDLLNLPSLNTFADPKISLPSDSFGFILFCDIDIMKDSPLSKLQKITGNQSTKMKFGINVTKQKNDKTPKLELYGDVADFSLAEDIHINKAVAQYIWEKDYQSLYLSCLVSFNSFEIKGAMYISEESVIIGTLKSDLPLSTAAKFGQKSNNEFTDLAPTNIRMLSLTSAKVAFNMSKPCMLIDGSIKGLGSGSMFIERGINKHPNFVLSVQVKNFKFSSLSDAGMFSEIDNLIQIKSAELLVYSLPESSLETLNNKITDIFQATLESHKDKTSLPSLNLYSSSHLDLLEKSSIEGSGVILTGALSFSENSFFHGLKEITDTSSLNEIQIGVSISKGNLKNAKPKLIFCGHLSEWLLTENDEIKVSNLMFRYTWEKGKQHLLAKGKVSIALGSGRLCVDAELNIQNDAATLTAKGFESDSIHGLKKIKGTVRNLKVEGILKKKKKPEVKITGLLDLKANICFNCLLHFEATKLTLLKITLSEEISVCSLLKAVDIESEDLESLDLVLKKGGTLYFASKSFTDSGENYKEGYDLNLTASVFSLDKEFSVHAHFSKKRKLEWMKGYACEKIKVAFVKFTDLEFKNGPAIVHKKGCTRFEVGIELFGWQFLQGTLSMIKKKERGRRGRTYFEGSPKLCLVKFFQPSITVRWRKKDFRIVKLELGLDPFELFGEFLGCIKKYAIFLYRLVKSLRPTPTVKVRFSTDENPDPDRYLMICNFTIVLGVMFLGFEIEALEIPIRIRIPTGFLADSWSQFLLKLAKENYAVIFETLWNVVRYELIKIPGNIVKSAVRNVVDAGKAVIEDARMVARGVVKAGKAIGSFFRCIFNCIKVKSDHGIAASIIGGKLYFDKESGKWECEPIEHSNKVPPFAELFGPYAAVIGIGQFIKDMCSACDGDDVTPEVDQMMKDLVHIDEISNLAQQEVSELLTVKELDMKLDSNNNISLSWKMDDEVTEKEEGKVDYIVTIIATVVSKGKITENELQLKYIRRRASNDPLIIKDDNFSKVVSRAISIKVSIKACVRMTVQPEFNKDIIPTDEQQMSRFRLRTGTELVRTEVTLLGKILHCEFFKEINHCQDLHPPVILRPYNNCLEKCISGEIETVENAAEYLVEIVDTTKRVLNRQLLSHSHNDNIGFSLKLPDSLADFQSPYQIRALSISSEGTSSEHHECMQLFNQQHLSKLSCLLNENLEAKLTLPFKSIDNFKSGLSVILKCTPEGKTPVYLMEHSLDLTSYQLCPDGEVVFYHKFSLEEVRKQFVQELICLESMVIAKGDENTLDSDPLLSNEINLLPTLKALNVFYSLEVGTLIVIWTQVPHAQAYKIEFCDKANRVPILTKIITVDDKDVLALLEECYPPHSIVKCTDYLPSVYFLSENDMKSLNRREYIVQITAMGPNCISSPSRETKIEFLATEMNYQKEDNTIQVIFEEREDYQYQVELVDVSDPALPISVYSHHFSMDKNRMKLQLNLASIKSKLHSASSLKVFIKCTNKNIVEYANLTPDKCQEKIWEHQVALEVETGKIQIFDFKALSQQVLCGYSSSEISVQQLSEESELLSVEIIKKSTKGGEFFCTCMSYTNFGTIY